MFFALSGLLFTSCSKDENSVKDPDPEMATLSFGAILEDFDTNRAASKQSLDELPECQDADPFYVMIILSQGGTNVVGSEEAPFRINLATDQLFTVEVPELELIPGTYSLDYFGVYSEAGDLIWLAPSGGILASYFDNPLPLEIDLRAGVKKYFDVPVVCFDNRFVNEYGYLFFDVNTNEAIKFCIFGNYCDDTGRHYPAAFSVDVWSYSNGAQGAVLYSDITNVVELNDAGDYSGTSVCFALPDTSGLDEYYFEITLLNSDAYGNVTEEIIRSGVINDDDVRDLFDGDDNTEYYHFREGNCGNDDSPNLFTEGGGGPGECDPNNSNDDCDNDGVNNGLDECPSTPPNVAVNAVGCDDVTLPGQDVVVFNDINIFDEEAMKDPDNVLLVQNLLNFSTLGSRNDGDVVLMDRGRGANCNTIVGNGECSDIGWSTMRSTIEGEGFILMDIFSTSGSLTEIPEDVKIVFLVMPTVAYTVSEINTLKAFAAQGGRIVFIGEHQSYYTGIEVENQFLVDMGAVLTNTGGSIDCSYNIIPSSSNREHPIMEGIEELTIACASVIELGPNDAALFYDISNTYVLAGVARIDTTPINQLSPVNNTKRTNVVSDVMSNPSSASGK
ncbi:hypothetical protein [Gillisia limnaea]|uniref:Thrombospondin type 3 repeat-containing protein n=2 Tax=Gillisia TaxID=244698 RepID=H2BUH9_GILLR|nr:hypothetical protein [Gillisia limnaea]EHQ03857.1 hypothetical protein Gilli_3250 [Gillisia limnaea DSM 15749]